MFSGDSESSECDNGLILKMCNYIHTKNQYPFQSPLRHYIVIHFLICSPMIEMTLPSSCDPTLAPPGCHVALFFTQYVPYNRADGRPWDKETKEEYAKKVGIFIT